MGRKHERLPALALFHLAVAHDGVDADGLLLELGTQCHAAGGGDALAQAAGGHIHARHRVHVGVALQVAADLTQGLQVFHRKIAALGQSGVQTGGRVALGEHQTVTVRCFRIFRVNVHVHEIEVRQHLCNVQAAARMAALGAVGPLDHAHADVAGVLCLPYEPQNCKNLQDGWRAIPWCLPRFCTIVQVYIIYSVQKGQVFSAKCTSPGKIRRKCSVFWAFCSFT